MRTFSVRLLDLGSQVRLRAPSCCPSPSAFPPGLRVHSNRSTPTSTKRHASSHRPLLTCTSRPALAIGSFSSTSSSTATTTATTTTTASPSSFFTPSLCRHRHSSTTSSPPPSPSASTSAIIASARAPSSSPSPSPSGLQWNTFFQLRASRRRYSLASSLFGSLATTATTVATLTNFPALQDQILHILTLDPMVSLGLTTFAGLGVGWLLGPFFGNFVWRTLHRGSLHDFVNKERAFFERIKKHRVDPRGASANNPVPDYYGEKVSSVDGYRGWLKDQRAFNRKRGGGQGMAN